MKHKIRQRVLDPVTGLKVTKIENVNGELGSGILDKNGREIFEGDLVKYTTSLISPASGLTVEREVKIQFTDGNFCYVETATPEAEVQFLIGLNQCALLEVIGHVDD